MLYTYMIESCHTNRVHKLTLTRMNESCLIYEFAMSHIWMSHVTHINESCHTYEWPTSHIQIRRGTQIVFVSSHSDVAVHNDESCLIYECAMSHSWRSHVTHLNESCHTDGWVMSHIWKSHVTHMNESRHTNRVCKLALTHCSARSPQNRRTR